MRSRLFPETESLLENDWPWSLNPNPNIIWNDKDNGGMDEVVFISLKKPNPAKYRAMGQLQVSMLRRRCDV
ncbi:hypothetical protein quinque_009293 [Culex quinquefasciatus]